MLDYKKVARGMAWAAENKPEATDIDAFFENCIAKKFFDNEEKRTGKRPSYALISCPCSKCNPRRM